MDRLLLFLHRFRPLLAHTPRYASRHWCYSRIRLVDHSRITEVSTCTHDLLWKVRRWLRVVPLSSTRWLLDTDQDAEGMRVIADLYGAGDPHNRHAKREFREIKEAVLADVSPNSL